MIGVVVFFLLAVGGLFYAQKDDYSSKRSRTGWSVLFGWLMTVVVVYAGAIVSLYVTSDHETDAMKQNTDILRGRLVSVWPEVGQATERVRGTVEGRPGVSASEVIQGDLRIRFPFRRVPR